LTIFYLVKFPRGQLALQLNLLVRVALCLVPIVLLGGLAYWFYVQPSVQLQTERKAVVDKALSFLNEFLWNSTAGAYRECPLFTAATCAKNYPVQDNYLGYIFNTEYIANQSKATEIHRFLVSENFSYSDRWIVLSPFSANFTKYPCSTCNPATPYADNWYADHVALDGIYDWRVGNSIGARERFTFLVGNMIDPRLGLFRDNATDGEGFVYYKLSLALILASDLKNSTYTAQFSEALASQQNPDGSWLTGPPRPAGVFPNTESTILNIIALKAAWNL
jgi:hypothetical protein